LSQKNYKEYAAKELNIEFNDIQILVTAFTHRSYLNEHRKSASHHNERLEFLGDAVLELAVTRYLYINYDQPEGVLTNWRSALVRTESIAAAAKSLKMAEYLRLSRGEKQGSERARQQILANTFEAVTGAIYFDQGYDIAEKFIAKNILNKLDKILDDGSWMDAKSLLQEEVQKDEGFTPVYKVITEEGPDHEKSFVIAVLVDNEERGRGEGPSKQLAQQEAAENALKGKLG
jgi:ribonuclease III